MNQKDKYKLKRMWLEKLDLTSRGHMNCIRCGKNETPMHKIVKSFICWKVNPIFFYPLCELFNDVIPGDIDGLEFQEYITEAYSECRKFRADIVLFTEPVPMIIEIANPSESKGSLERKNKFWTSKGFSFVEVRI